MLVENHPGLCLGVWAAAVLRGAGAERRISMKYGWKGNVPSLIAAQRFVRLILDAYLALRMFFGAVTSQGTLMLMLDMRQCLGFKIWAVTAEGFVDAHMLSLSKMAFIFLRSSAAFPCRLVSGHVLSML
jgi:hypothetical protein